MFLTWFLIITTRLFLKKDKLGVENLISVCLFHGYSENEFAAAKEEEDVTCEKISGFCLFISVLGRSTCASIEPKRRMRVALFLFYFIIPFYFCFVSSRANYFYSFCCVSEALFLACLYQICAEEGGGITKSQRENIPDYSCIHLDLVYFG